MPRKDFSIVRDKFARDSGLPFGRLLTREFVLSALADEGHAYRSRVFCPLVTLWGWLSQCLSQDKSLNEAVSRIVAHRVSTGLPACSASSASYSDARGRFPEAAMTRMAKEIGRKVHDSGSTDWDWHGRKVFLADGTTFTMADTEENQLAFPQAVVERRGLGFPITRAVALISLATGAAVDIAFAKYAGKGTGEASLFRDLMGNLSRGDIVVADRYYPTFPTLAMLLEAGVDMVSISHVQRVIDFTQGEILGPKDHIIEYSRRRDKSTRDILPDTIRIREFAIEIDGRDGGKEEAIVVTTMIDPSIPQIEISDLYWSRWNCELDIRAIKHSMQMNFLRAKTPSMVRKEIWCHLLAYNLLRGTMVETAKRHAILPRQISVKGAMQAVESFTPAMMAIDGNDALYSAMLTTVSAHRVANRPGRQEPRLKKSRPVWDAYLMKPRNEYNRRLNRDVATVPLS